MPELPRVAVVGVGGLFPGAASPEQLWRNVLAARQHLALSEEHYETAGRLRLARHADKTAP